MVKFFIKTKEGAKIMTKILGLLVTLLGVYMLYQEILKRVKCKEITKGTVVDFYEKTKKENGREKIVRYPIFEYAANGIAVRNKYTTKSKMHPYELSDEVDIFYNVNNADEFYIKGNGDSFVLGTIVLIMGVLVLFA